MSLVLCYGLFLDSHVPISLIVFLRCDAIWLAYIGISYVHFDRILSMFSHNKRLVLEMCLDFQLRTESFAEIQQTIRKISVVRFSFREIGLFWCLLFTSW